MLLNQPTWWDVEKVIHNTYILKFLSDKLTPQNIFNKGVEHDPVMLKFISDHINTQEMCKKTVIKF